MARPKSLFDYSKEELQGICDRAGVVYDKDMGTTKLVELLKAHHEATKEPLPDPPPAPPAPVATSAEELPTTTMAELRAAMEEVKTMKAELQLKLQEQPKFVPQPGENLGTADLVKIIAQAVKLSKDGETNDVGTMRQEFVDLSDRLEKPARFWCRSIGYHMHELMIGPVPQAFPYNIKTVDFINPMGPFAVKDNNYPIPQVWVISRFETSIKSLAELLRKDVRYGTRFTEDSSILFGIPKLDEWQLAKTRHLAMLNAQHDPMYPSAKARELGVPFTSNSNQEGLRIAVAEKMADNEIAATNAMLMENKNQRARELSLATSV